MAKIDNALQQVIKLHNLIEQTLRRATSTKTPMTMPEIQTQGDIAACAKTRIQTRDVVRNLVAKGYVLKNGEGRDTKYAWNPEAAAYVVPEAVRRAALRQPSKVVKLAPPAKRPYTKRQSADVIALPARRAPQSKDVELVIGDTQITIGKNPATGRLRIMIEEAHAAQAVAQ